MFPTLADKGPIFVLFGITWSSGLVKTACLGEFCTLDFKSALRTCENITSKQHGAIREVALYQYFWKKLSWKSSSLVHIKLTIETSFKCKWKEPSSRRF